MSSARTGESKDLPALPGNMKANQTPGAQVCEIDRDRHVWRLGIPAGPSDRYRLAQLDDYLSLPRRAFLWSPPLHLSLYARSSSRSIPGTWGFGLWNDPFSMGVLSKSGGKYLPVLPNAAWFFFGSPINYLSLSDAVPANGWLASTFRSPLLPSAFSLLAIPALPLLLLPPAMRLLRKFTRSLVRQEAITLDNDPTVWSYYELFWETECVEFHVNNQLRLRASVAPAGLMGLVIWVDNQYASLPPDGRLRYGFLSNSEPAWIEIGSLSIARI